MTTKNFILPFGQYKGQNFATTPASYQQWLLRQEWFKLPKNTARYDVVRKFVPEYVVGMGRKYERVMLNLSWEDANQQKDMMNLYHLDECTDYFYIEASQN
jgi:hypothetical protein